MFYVAGITISGFLFLALLLKKNKGAADYVLAAWMLVASVHQLLFYVIWSGIAFQHPHLLGISLPIPVLYGVMLFFYVSEITEEKPFTLRFALPHLLPFLLLVVLAIPFFSLSAAEKMAVYENEGRDYLWYQYLQLALFVLTTVGYCAWSLTLIRRNRRKAEQFFSNTDKRNLKWLEYLIMGLGGICLLVLFFGDAIVFIGVTVLLIFIGLYGINQTSIFRSERQPAAGAAPTATGELATSAEATLLGETTAPGELAAAAEPTLPAETTAPGEANRYAKSGLKEAGAEQLYRRLTQLMQTEMPFVNPDLTLSELAKSLAVHPNYLSQVINERERKNFYNYVNTLRVEEFLRRSSLPENKRFTWLALAFDCGFNSKSTFNKYFKTHFGKTPSEYFEAANA